jgi:hypothetical protein
LIGVDSDVVCPSEISLPIRVIKIDHVEAVQGLDRILLIVHPVRVLVLPRDEDVCVTVKRVELEGHILCLGGLELIGVGRWDGE